MKDGRTHLAHKAEHAVDLTTEAVLAVTVQPASEGDTKTIQSTLEEAQKQVTELVDEGGIKEVVADKGYHSGDVLRQLDEQATGRTADSQLYPGARPSKAALAEQRG